MEFHFVDFIRKRQLLHPQTPATAVTGLGRKPGAGHTSQISPLRLADLISVCLSQHSALAQGSGAEESSGWPGGVKGNS